MSYEFTADKKVKVGATTLHPGDSVVLFSLPPDPVLVDIFEGLKRKYLFVRDEVAVQRDVDDLNEMIYNILRTYNTEYPATATEEIIKAIISQLEKHL
jgi:hypothetical protein